MPWNLSKRLCPKAVLNCRLRPKALVLGRLRGGHGQWAWTVGGTCPLHPRTLCNFIIMAGLVSILTVALDIFGRPLLQFNESANVEETRTRMGSGSEAET